MKPAAPNVTTLQIVAIGQAVIALAIAFGLPITDEQSAAIIQLATALAIALPLADAHLRSGRARYYAALARVQKENA
jgi:hypothetical protein